MVLLDFLCRSGVVLARPDCNMDVLDQSNSSILSRRCLGIYDLLGWCNRLLRVGKGNANSYLGIQLLLLFSFGLDSILLGILWRRSR